MPSYNIELWKSMPWGSVRWQLLFGDGRCRHALSRYHAAKGRGIPSLQGDCRIWANVRQVYKLALVDEYFREPPARRASGDLKPVILYLVHEASASLSKVNWTIYERDICDLEKRQPSCRCDEGRKLRSGLAPVIILFRRSWKQWKPLLDGHRKASWKPSALQNPHRLHLLDEGRRLQRASDRSRR